MDYNMNRHLNHMQSREVLLKRLTVADRQNQKLRTENGHLIAQRNSLRAQLHAALLLAKARLDWWDENHPMNRGDGDE